MLLSTPTALDLTRNHHSDIRMGDAHEARRPAVSYIGQPIHFASGQFAGQTVRTKLIEVQKAELGRK